MLYATRVPGTIGRLSRQPLAELMQPVVTVPAEALLYEALSEMVRHGVHHLAAVDEQGHCLGVIGDWAVAQGWATDHSPLHHQTVQSALDAVPAVITANSVVGDAARLMGMAGVRVLAVVDNHRHPMGIVTGADLVALLADDTDEPEGGEQHVAHP